MRIALLLGTNFAVIIIASLTLRLLGVDHYLMQNGGLNLNALLIFAAVFGFGGAFFSLLISKPIAKWSTRAQVITHPTTPDEKWLMQTVAELSERAGIKMPEVAIFPAQESNAFATGWNKNDALVAVSQGILYRFNRDELRAVLGHEIAHVANGDMVTLSLIQGVVNTFVIFLARVIGYVVDKAVFKTERGVGVGYYVTSIVAEIVLGILASSIVCWFSRRREFAADEGGANLAGRGAMIQALARLQQESQAHNPLPDHMQAFAINQGVAAGLAKFFATHPPLEERIAALQNK
ncbi:MAG: protease HtpX [Kangiellaceae bacterium]|nr:protease HtpX [Kangiellaceae bacterium]